MDKSLGYFLVGALIMFFVYMVYRGRKKGVVSILYTIIALVVCMTISAILTEPITHYIKNETGIYKEINKSVSKKIDEVIGDSVAESREELNDAIINETGFPKSVSKQIVENKNADKMFEKGNEEFCKYVSKALSVFCIKIIVSVVIMLITYALLMILSQSLKIISRLPVIYQFDKAIGSVLGAVEAIILIWLIFVAISYFSYTEYGKIILNTVEGNSILSWLYDNSCAIMINIFK